MKEAEFSKYNFEYTLKSAFRLLFIGGGYLLLIFNFASLKAQVFECQSEELEMGQSETETENGSECYSLNFCQTERIKYSSLWEQAPVVNINVNFHFLRTASYGQNFGPENGNCSACIDNDAWSGFDVAQYLVDACNARLANMQDQMLRRNLNAYDPVTEGYLNPGVPFLDKDGNPVPNLGDSKFRLVLYDPDNLSAVHFHELPDNKYHANSNLSDHPDCEDGQIPIPFGSFKTNYSVYNDQVIDIFIMDEYYPVESYIEDNTVINCRALRGVANGGANGIYNMWYYWQSSAGNISAIQNQVGNILHEIGHSLNLRHPFEFNQCCDIEELPFANPEFFRKNTYRWCFDISNNIMGYNNQTNFFTPCQLDVMHHNARLVSFTEVVGEDLVAGCVKGSGMDEVDEDEIWNEDRMVTRDVVIRSGATLEITGNICIGLAKDVRIHVERGAMLFIHDDMGSPWLKTLCTKLPSSDRELFPDHWGGIRVAGNTARPHPTHWLDEFNSDGQDPGRVVIIGARISEARHAVSDNWALEYRPDFWGGFVHCDNVEFKSCHRVAEFMRNRRPNKSKFKNCTVIGRSKSLTNPDATGMGISIWDCRGIEISGCEFDQLHNYALYTLNGDFKVLAGNTFKNFKNHAIFAGRPNNSPVSLNSDIKIKIGSEQGPVNLFEQNVVDIRIEGYNNRVLHEIQNNHFKYNNKDVFGNVGVEATHTFYEVRNNTFTNKYVGVSTIFSDLISNRVRENIIEDAYYGLQYIQRNAQSQFQCNLLDGYRWGVWVHAKSTIAAEQGSQTYSNANRWIRSRNTSGILDIAVSQIDLEPAGPNSGSINDGLFKYRVQEDVPLNDPLRPVCNLTHPCVNSGFPQDYSIADARENEDCNRIGSSLTDDEELSIQELQELTDSLQVADSLFDSNPVYIALANRKFNKISDTIGILWQAEQFNQVDSLLAMQSEAVYHWYRYGTQLELGNFTAAAAILNANALQFTDEENTDIAIVQQSNLAREQDFTYRPDSTSRLLLKQIAMKPGIAGGHARALLTWWYDEVWLPYVIQAPGDSSMQAKPETTDNSLAPSGHSTPTLGSYIIYPNPGTGIYEIRNAGLTDTLLDISVIRPGDSKVVSKLHSIVGQQNGISLDIQHLPSGLYIVRIDSDNNTSPQIVKLIKW